MADLAAWRVRPTESSVSISMCFAKWEVVLSRRRGRALRMFCTSVLPKWLHKNKLACVKSPPMGDGSNSILFQSSVLCLPPAALSQLQLRLFKMAEPHP